MRQDIKLMMIVIVITKHTRKMYRICWLSIFTQARGCGDAIFTYDQAKEITQDMRKNNHYPGIIHWFELCEE